MAGHNLSDWQSEWQHWSIADKAAAVYELSERCMTAAATAIQGSDLAVNSLIKSIDGLCSETEHAVDLAGRNRDKISVALYNRIGEALRGAFERIVGVCQGLQLIENDVVLDVPTNVNLQDIGSEGISGMAKSLDFPTLNALIMNIVSARRPPDQQAINPAEFQRQKFSSTETDRRLNIAIACRLKRPQSPSPAQRKFTSPVRAPPRLYKDKLAGMTDREIEMNSSLWADLELVKRWMRSCDEKHGEHCQLVTDPGTIYDRKPKWLIDVERKCLVYGHDDYEYLALSYVWGKGASPFRTTRRRLDDMLVEGFFTRPRKDDKIPKTVLDSISLTKLLGHQYLWVDSLCIVQDDEDELKNQLEAMTSIYANAWLTIVSIADSANGGLRGIRCTTPPFRRDEEQAKSLHEAIETHSKRVERSTWSQRGWTFQEQILSRRVLILSSADVSWECHCAVWIEGMEPTEGKCGAPQTEVNQGSSLALAGDMKTYARFVDAYNSRQLTYEDDIAQAFAGILTTLSPNFQGGFASGLPIDHFDLALLWRNQQPLDRRYLTSSKVDGRSPVPSWSWQNWLGQLSLDVWNDEQQKALKPLVRWEYKTNLGAPWYPVTKLPSTDREESRPSSLNHASQVIDTTTVGASAYTSENDEVTSARTTANLSLRDPNPASNAMSSTKSATELAKTPRKSTYSGPSWELRQCPLYLRTKAERLHVKLSIFLSTTCINHGISTPSSTFAGQLASLRTIGITLDMTCEIIAISETTVPMTLLCDYATLDVRWQNHERYKKSCDAVLAWKAEYEKEMAAGQHEGFVNVLWIEWWRGVAYRKGVGQVLKSVWDEERKAGRVGSVDVVIG